MENEERLAKKGRLIPYQAVAQEGQVHIVLAQQHAPDLADNGWGVADTQELEGNVTVLLVQVGERSGAKGRVADATRQEGLAIDGAKGFIKKVRLAAPRAIRDLPDAGVSLKAFEYDEPVLRSTPKIVAYLSSIRPAVVLLDPALQRAFKGTKASAVLDQVLTALVQADGAQEAFRKEGPTHTRTLHITAGRVLEQIEDLNRAAKAAFGDRPDIAAKFNKAIIERALPPKKKAAKAKAAPPPAPAAGTTTTPAATTTPEPTTTTPATGTTP